MHVPFGRREMTERLEIPRDAASFFEDFLPQQFTRDRHRYPRHDSPGSASFEVFGVGTWVIKMKSGGLLVRRGRQKDTLLQLGMSDEDFKDIFVDRTQREIDSIGDLSHDSRNAFNPLFVDARKVDAVLPRRGGPLETLTIRLEQGGAVRRLFITPGPFARTEPRATVTLRTADFLAMLSGRKSPTALFLRGRVKVRGDLSYALRIAALLS